jgi:hypothetical protein
MFAKAKKLSYQDFVASLIFKNKEGKILKVTYKTFLKGLDNPSLLSTIVGILNNRSVSFPHKDVTSFEVNFFRNKVHEMLVKHLDEFNLQERTEELSGSLLTV